MTIHQTDSEPLQEQLSSIPVVQKRGRLKIYFGYAAGVGKTSAMLKDAHEMKSNGIDVVAGYIEPHARPETAALLEGIEALPVLNITYKDVLLKSLIWTEPFAESLSSFW